MKTNTFGIFLFLVFSMSYSQEASCQKVNFVGNKMQVPKGCDKVSDFEIECGTFTLSWAYMDKGNLENVLFNQISQLQKLSDFDYKPIRVAIDQVPSSGFITSFTADHIKYFMLLAAGTVRDKNVLIQGIDVVPFWRYKGHNEIFEKLIQILPDDDKIKMDVESVGPVDETKKDGQ
ncbi:MAG: hypothetical protein J5I59_01740 [Saprospiraceae bacterium]|nr:hypothetical protein [Saprospiraceae bacterium]